MKTAALFALACELGAYLTNEDDKATQRTLREYGKLLGIAFQIYDDCLDVFGTEDKAGKSLGTDLATGKATLPMLLALERANVIEHKSWLAMLQAGESQADAVRERLVAEGIPTACRVVVADFVAQAISAVEDLSGASKPLVVLSECLTRQLALLDD